MEEHKNNAVEKAENAEVTPAKKSSAKTKKSAAAGAKKSTTKKSPAKPVKSGKKVDKKAKENIKKQKIAEKKRLREEAKKKRVALKAENKRKKEAVKAEKEKIRAEKRVEIARLKAHKKAEKAKAKATAQREKNRRIAEAKARKAEIKAEKERRRDMLKKETKKQRAERIREEKAAKIEAKREKRARIAEERKQKFLARKEQKRRRAENRQKNKEARRGYGGWLAAVISLGCATLVLASVLTFVFLMPTAEEGALESVYRRSFYDTVDQVDNMDLNLSKVLATKDGGAVQGYLLDLAVNSELAESDVQQLPLRDESKYYTTKIINQIGDYAKYLNKKLINGEPLTQKEYDNLSALYEANAALKRALNEMNESMSNDFSFSSIAESGNGNLVVNNFNELQNLSVEYPELIYDGPFSDGKDREEIKGLSGEKITEATARDSFAKLFADFNPQNVKSEGTTESGIRCFNVAGEADGELLYAQISETGGKLVMFAYAGTCKEVNIDKDLAEEKGSEFLEKAGITGMTPVWINLSNNVYTINYAYVQDGVIIYSDLVKIRVCAETSKVIGMEATSYYTNHTERVIASPAIGEKTAKTKVSDNIDIDSARLVVIPIGEKTEKLCYEFHGEYEGSDFYVYIDAANGRQAEMFKVIKSTEGELLM